MNLHFHICPACLAEFVSASGIFTFRAMECKSIEAAADKKRLRNPCFYIMSHALRFRIVGSFYEIPAKAVEP
jgi:hypothetical protein